MKQPILMIPGPVDPPEAVMRIIAREVPPHYEKDFSEFYLRLLEKMKKIFGTENGEAHIPNGSGTMALNMMLASFCTPDASVLVVNNGAFGEYGKKNLSSLNIPFEEVKAPPGEEVDYDAVRREMRGKKHKFIFVTHNESSTAMVNPLKPLGDLAREFDALLLVDSISAVGGMVINIDETGADVVAGASQKCLELPPGLAPLAFSERAKKYLDDLPKRPIPRVLDLKVWSEYLVTEAEWHPQPITGATNMLAALDWMADAILEEGVEKRQERFRQVGERLKKEFVDMGFTIPVPPETASPVVTEFVVPDGFLAEDFREHYIRKHNVMVGRGERMNADGEAISFRIAHFGRAAEKKRVDMMIEITKAFSEKL